MEFLFNKTIDLLSGMIGYRMNRHQLIVSNIANVDTPGFKPSDLSFQNEFDQTHSVQMAATNPRHIQKNAAQNGKIDYTVEQSTENVVIDKEMSNLAENHLMYNTTVEMLARKFRGIETVLKETK